MEVNGGEQATVEQVEVAVPTEPEGAEPPVQDAPPEAEQAAEPEEFNLLGDDQPEWVQQFEELQKITVTKEELAEIEQNPTMQKLYANLRRMANTKVNEAHTVKSGAEDDRKAIAQERAKLEAERKALYDLFSPEKLKTIVGEAPADNEAPPDPFSEEGIEWRVREGVRKVFESIHAESEKTNAEFTRQQNKAELAAFAEQHGGEQAFMDKYGNRIIELRQKHPTMHWREAFDHLHTQDQLEALKSEQAQRAATSRAVDDARMESVRALAGGSHSEANSDDIPEFDDPVEQALWFQRNPEAEKAFREREKRLQGFR